MSISTYTLEQGVEDTNNLEQLKKDNIYDKVCQDKQRAKVTTHCSPYDIAFAMTSWDAASMCNVVDFFETRYDAIEYVMELIGAKRSIDDYNVDHNGTLTFKSNPKLYRPLVEQKDGKLYLHRVSYNHERTSLLFDPDKYINPPRTKQELRKFLANGFSLTVSWDDIPAVYNISNMMLVRVVMDGEKEVSVGYRPVTDQEQYTCPKVYNGPNKGRYYNEDTNEYFVFRSIML